MPRAPGVDPAERVTVATPRCGETNGEGRDPRGVQCAGHLPRDLTDAHLGGQIAGDIHTQNRQGCLAFRGRRRGGLRHSGLGLGRQQRVGDRDLLAAPLVRPPDESGPIGAVEVGIRALEIWTTAVQRLEVARDARRAAGLRRCVELGEKRGLSVRRERRGVENRRAPACGTSAGGGH